ncbi:TonB-dependent receptor family protein [Methylophilus methylotrophus]|uniref:TonB-dependent receptor family protein n=1 Tax=Methylophilus methylotrophus TaxID=17 RepID=UPI0003A86FC9|nr:TonB-dependent receptor [Methylophilus methylotrophus]
MKMTLKWINAAVLSAFSTIALSDDVSQVKPHFLEVPRVDVIGTKDQQFKQSSTSTIIEQQELESAHVMTTNEALRKVPGVVVRDEEGFGMRPNISIRGLNPTRSTKVLLLEDGIPLAYAPYGDNASYYYPAIDRFSSIEVLKGAEQIKFGPQTIGGVINHITPNAPQAFGGYVSATAGNRDFLNTKINVGGNGMLLDYTHKQGDGARDNTYHNVDDLNFKLTKAINDYHGVTFRANYFSEDSQVSYSGLTRAEYINFGGRYNPFKRDDFETTRYGTSVTHDWQISSDLSLITNYYYSYFTRDWWRQQSNSSAGNIATGVGCAAVGNGRILGLEVDTDTCQGNQGRLRTYDTYGVEPRLSWSHDLGQLDIGIKAHYEEQRRVQKNGTSASARDGAISENNFRETNAYSGFISNRFDFGDFHLTPAIRYEHVENKRKNGATSASSLVTRGESTIHEWVPGVSLAYTPNDQYTVFAGVHEGFAPPRTEDLIGANGGSVDVGVEKSKNYELGFRARPNKAFSIESTLFYNDFDNLIAVGSVASNVALSEGKAKFGGLEILGRYDFDNGLYSRIAYTWLPLAEQESPFRNVLTNAIVGGSASGNRQPYAPKNTVTAAFGYKLGQWDAMIEAVHVGRQYADFAETKVVDITGQFGEISSYTIYNAAINYKMPAYKTTLFLVGKNIFDKEYIVDRTRGILTGMPALIQVGARYDF